MGEPVSNGLCRFFPEGRDLFFWPSDAAVMLMANIQPMLDSLHAAGLISRDGGYVRAELTTDGREIVAFGFGTEHSPYDDVAAGKLDLAHSVRVGSDFSTRFVQQVATMWLRGDSIVHYGTFERDGLVVGFSGLQPYWDEKIAEIAWALIAGLQDLRKDQLEQVRRALKLTYYWQAMNAIEAVAKHFGYTAIASAVKRIVDDATLRSAQAILNDRWAEDRVGITPGPDPSMTVPEDSGPIALALAYGPAKISSPPGVGETA